MVGVGDVGVPAGVVPPGLHLLLAAQIEAGVARRHVEAGVAVHGDVAQERGAAPAPGATLAAPPGRLTQAANIHVTMTIRR